MVTLYRRLCGQLRSVECTALWTECPRLGGQCLVSGMYSFIDLVLVTVRSALVREMYRLIQPVLEIVRSVLV